MIGRTRILKFKLAILNLRCFYNNQVITLIRGSFAYSLFIFDSAYFKKSNKLLSLRNPKENFLVKIKLQYN